MIVSPRANEVIDIVRITGKRLIEIDKVFLYRRVGDGDASYEKIDFWERDGDNSGANSGNGQCRCEQTSKTCVILVEADYDTENQTFDHFVKVLNGDGNFSGETLHLDHIILEMEASNSE